MIENHPDYNSFTYCYNNPVNLIDPLGMDSVQRAKAVAKAEDYVDKNPGNSYSLGGKGDPGKGVDCSGMVSKCIIAGDEEDPVGKSTGNGVRQIANLSEEIDIADSQVGNAIVLDNSDSGNDKPYGHIGIISNIIKDKDGNVLGFDFIDSGGSPKKGKSGPRNSSAMIGSNYWGKRITGVYKWDTKPDIQSYSGVQNNTKSHSKMGPSAYSFVQGRGVVGNWIMNHTPIGTGAHDIGAFVMNLGF